MRAITLILGLVLISLSPFTIQPASAEFSITFTRKSPDNSGNNAGNSGNQQSGNPQVNVQFSDSRRVQNADFQRYNILFQPVNVGKLNKGEKRLLQLGLSAAGHYDGLLDGAWGPRSQRSLEAYARKKFGAPPFNLHLAVLMNEMFAEIEDKDWDYVYDRPAHLSFLLPFKVLPRQPQMLGNGIQRFWTKRGTNLKVSTRQEIEPQMQGRHNRFARAQTRKGIFKVRNSKRWVTSFTNLQGVSWYVRSDKVGANWSTIIISADQSTDGLLSVIASSISVGNNVEWGLQKDGHLNGLMALAREFASANGNVNDNPNVYKENPYPEFDQPEPPVFGPLPPVSDNDRPDEPQRPSGNIATGSGFFINRGGAVVTSNQLVESCQAIRANDIEMDVLYGYEGFDLAVIVPQRRMRQRDYLEIARRSAEVDDNVTIAAFPDNDYFYDPRITEAMISGTTGINDNPIHWRVNPQKRRSVGVGAPVVNQYGQLVGIMVSKLDEIMKANVRGQISRRTELAVKSELLTLMLDAKDISYATSGTKNKSPLSTRALNDKLIRATALVECER